jgi:hypothetical protein
MRPPVIGAAVNARFSVLLRTAGGTACAVLLAVTACAPRSAVPPAAPVPASTAPTSAVSASATASALSTAPAVPASSPSAAVKPAKPASFSVSRVLADTRAIEKFGVRVSGSAAERRAADYVAGRLRSMGYAVTVQKFPVPGGVSRNVTARVTGTDPRVLVLGGHLDTRSTTPGANDNALGCAIVLETARIFAAEKPPVSLELTCFGAEEYNDSGTPRDHHRGSRYHVARMRPAQKKQVLGMISVDVVGYGTELHTRTMRIGPMTMSDYLLRRAAAIGVRISYSKDPGPTGWSDHEPYEKAGIPAVWLERLQDPSYHKAGDTTAHLQAPAIRACGTLVLDAIRHLNASAAKRIARR